MAKDIPNIIETALALNLDQLKYGTIIEIGAGREVAWGRLSQPRTELDLGLPAGVYHLQVEGMGGVKWAIR